MIQPAFSRSSSRAPRILFERVRQVAPRGDEHERDAQSERQWPHRIEG
jgi:hypothetical protein